MSGFNVPPFNNEQLAHMRSIASMPDEQVSWCGWGRAGDPHCCCNPECEGKTEGKTMADKKAVWCPACRNYPRNGVLTHSRFCTRAEPTKGKP